MEFSFDFNVETKEEGEHLIEEKIYDLLIIGAGPAGLNAGIYAKRKGLDVGIIGKTTGGQVRDTSSVENYLGFNYMTGENLVNRFLEHVKILEIPIVEEYIISVDIENAIKKINTESGKVYLAKTIIIATGSKTRKLGVAGEEEFGGRGVAYCAICDGPLFKNKKVAIAGGGNSAVEAAIDMSKIASEVVIVHRGQLKADQVIIDKAKDIENIRFMLNMQITEIVGEKVMTGLKLKNKLDEKELFLEVDGVFVEIGYDPNTDLFKDRLKLNQKNEIEIDFKNRTNIEGVFAAGDVTSVPYKQIIISVGEGAKAALSVNDFINN